jgi:hypothetical protein
MEAPAYEFNIAAHQDSNANDDDSFNEDLDFLKGTKEFEDTSDEIE